MNCFLLGCREGNRLTLEEQRGSYSNLEPSIRVLADSEFLKWRTQRDYLLQIFSHISASRPVHDLTDCEFVCRRIAPKLPHCIRLRENLLLLINAIGRQSVTSLLQTAHTRPREALNKFAQSKEIVVDRCRYQCMRCHVTHHEHNNKPFVQPPREMLPFRDLRIQTFSS